MWKLCFIWGISQSPGDQFAERMLFLMVVTLVWIQLQIHLGKKKNQELLTLHPSQKKIVFTEKKKTFKRSWTSTSVPKPRNCKPHAAAERQPLMVASDIPTAMPNSRALPTLELGVFSKKEWLSQSARWNVVILQESSWESKGTPPPMPTPPRRKIRPC